MPRFWRTMTSMRAPDLTLSTASGPLVYPQRWGRRLPAHDLPWTGVASSTVSVGLDAGATDVAPGRDAATIGLSSSSRGPGNLLGRRASSRAASRFRHRGRPWQPRRRASRGSSISRLRAALQRRARRHTGCSIRSATSSSSRAPRGGSALGRRHRRFRCTSWEARIWSRGPGGIRCLRVNGRTERRSR